jgi:hypothetical protein
MTDVTRRDFLKIAFGTISVAAISGPMAAIWPAGERNRQVVEPWRVVVEHGYLCDPDWSPDGWPTCREHWDYDSLSHDDRAEQLLQYAGYDAQLLDDEYGIEVPDGGWDDNSLAELEAALGGSLDGPVSSDRLSFHEHLWLGPYAVGAHLLGELPAEECDRLGLWLVEGEHPGSDFCGVRFDGDVMELNAALASHGINVVIGDVIV